MSGDGQSSEQETTKATDVNISKSEEEEAAKANAKATALKANAATNLKRRRRSEATFPNNKPVNEDNTPQRLEWNRNQEEIRKRYQC